MSNQYTERLAFRQARTVLLISLALGIFFTLLEVFLDLRQERNSLIGEINRTLELHSQASSLAIYNLNTAQAEKITRTLIDHPVILKAELVDDFGDILSFHERQGMLDSHYLHNVAEAFFDYQKKVEKQLPYQTGQENPGYLLIEIDTPYIAEKFINRAMTSFTLGVLHNLVLGLVFLATFHYFLSKPLLKIVNWVNNLNQNNASASFPYHRKDEISFLVNAFHSTWLEKEQMTERLNQMLDDVSRSESFLRSLMDHAGDAIFLCDNRGSIVLTNIQATKKLGYSKNQLAEMNFADFSQTLTPKTAKELFNNINAEEVFSFEDRQVTKDNQDIPIEARCIRLVHDHDEYILILARDISQRKEDEKRIYELAFFDSLTGLANRRLFLDRLQSSLNFFSTQENLGAVLYMDMDNFKAINDSLGHPVGDELLKCISARLTNILPNSATCARFGGDEFVILLPKLNIEPAISAELAAQTAQEVLDTLSIPYDVKEHRLYCTVSIGIAIFNLDDSPLETLRRADTALYRAKTVGRNCFQFYNSEMQSSAQQRLETEKELHQAVENDEFVLFIQPQVDSHQRIISAEILLRWKHPQKGLIAPGNFIRIAEESGQIINIGQWVLERSLQYLADWIKQGLPDSFRRLAINISPLQFMQVDFVENILNLIQQYDIPAEYLEIEITENLLLQNMDIASKKMQLLKQRGINFAIDDFGTGYSSLKYLKYLPLDVLKIDRSFVTNLHISPEESAIVEVIIATADRLNLDLIAEGVELEEEKNKLSQLGCNIFQGYLFGRPMPADDFYQLLLEKEESPIQSKH